MSSAGYFGGATSFFTTAEKSDTPRAAGVWPFGDVRVMAVRLLLMVLGHGASEPYGVKATHEPMRRLYDSKATHGPAAVRRQQYAAVSRQQYAWVSRHESLRRGLDDSSLSEWAPIRMRIREGTITLSSEMRDFLLSTLLQSATGWLESALRVRPVDGQFYAARGCNCLRDGPSNLVGTDGLAHSGLTVSSLPVESCERSLLDQRRGIGKMCHRDACPMPSEWQWRSITHRCRSARRSRSLRVHDLMHVLDLARGRRCRGDRFPPLRLLCRERRLRRQHAGLRRHLPARPVRPAHRRLRQLLPLETLNVRRRLGRPAGDSGPRADPRARLQS